MNTTNNTPLLPCPNKHELTLSQFRDEYPLISTIGLCKEVGVFSLTPNHRFRRVDRQVISGVSALIPKAFILRVPIADVADKSAIEAELRAAEAAVRERFPIIRMLPSHPAWVKRTLNGSVHVHALFGAVDVKDEANHANSRLTRLIGHIDGESRYLGRRRVRVIRGDNPWMRWDGWCAVNPNTIHCPWPTMKVYGVENFGTDYIINGGPTIKCCGETSSRTWKALCRHLHIQRDACDVIVPEVSLKFDDGRDEFTVELFSVFASVLGEHFAVSLQMLMNVPLTGEAHLWAAGRVISLIREISDALKDPTGIAVADLMNSHAAEVAAGLANGDCEEGIIEEGTEAMNSLITRIVAGLPIETSKYLKGVLPVLARRLRSFTIAGGSEMVLPDDTLKAGEVSISRRMAKAIKRKYGIDLTVGSAVLVARYPITGTEVALARVAAIGRPAVNTTWWIERFSGDFDGDRYAIGTLAKEGIDTFVNEDAFTYPPKSEKVKTKVPMTIVEANAAGVWSQTMIPAIDRYLRICNEKGLNAGPMKNLLQWVIDSSKNQIDFNIEEICAEVGIAPRDRMSSLATLMSARFGGSKHNGLLIINGLIRRAKTEITHIPWMNLVRKSGVLSYYISGTGDPAYASLQSKVERSGANGYEKFLVFEMQRVYREVKADFLLTSASNMEDQAVYPVADLDQAKVQLIRKKALELPKEARVLAHQILAKYNAFVTTIRGGVNATTDAFRNIKEAVELVKASPYGDSALKYLFAALVLGVDPKIQMRATTVLGYMPLLQGSYNIAKINEYLGYRRELIVFVLQHGNAIVI